MLQNNDPQIVQKNKKKYNTKSWVISLAINMRFTCIAWPLQDYVQLHVKCITFCLTSEIISFIII